MNFRQSVTYLYSLGNEVKAMKLGLETITAVLEALGSPHRRYFKVQVAGTNGKGSVCAFLEAICLGAGIRTGMTTSPHLVSVTERVRIGGREISETDFADIATRVRAVSEELFRAGRIGSIPTYFEQVTAIALLAFAEAGVALAILETGLGGRFDAVTAARADLVAITPVGLDHQRILGDTIELIAAEKAAIIRPDTPVVVSDQPEAARRVIEAKCAAEDALVLPADFEVRRSEFDRATGRLTIGFRSRDDYRGVRLGLAGRHQISNARTAVVLAEALGERFGFPISRENIVRGLAEARHPGRLDRRGRYLFDGAHNESGAAALAEFLVECRIRPVMVFGAMRDKDLGPIARILFPFASDLILTRPENERAAETSELRRHAAELVPADRIHECPDVAAAVRKAADLSGADTILVTGSLYLVGEALREVSGER